VETVRSGGGERPGLAMRAAEQMSPDEIAESYPQTPAASARIRYGRHEVDRTLGTSIRLKPLGVVAMARWPRLADARLSI